jgi:predicted membrane metal-binding protein
VIRVRSIPLYSVAVALGVATMAAIGYQWLPPGVIAVSFALFFILLLPRHPRFVAAFCAGAALTVAVAFVFFTWVAWAVPAS